MIIKGFCKTSDQIFYVFDKDEYTNVGTVNYNKGSIIDWWTDKMIEDNINSCNFDKGIVSLNMTLDMPRFIFGDVDDEEE